MEPNITGPGTSVGLNMDSILFYDVLSSQLKVALNIVFATWTDRLIQR
jgi:hypothetical protein